MAKKDEKIVDKKTLINILFLNNLGYVNKLSEFVADSLRLNWLNFVETTKKEKYIDKIIKNIEKIKKLEKKVENDNFYNEIVVDNLIIINKHLKGFDTRFCKKIMMDIQNLSLLSSLLRYYLDKYLENCILIREKKIVDKGVTNVKKKEKCNTNEIEKNILTEIITDYDSSNYYYVHIRFKDNVMIFCKESFDLEVLSYYSNLDKNVESPFIIDSNLKFSVFEKKRRIYIKSMYDLDMMLCNLYNKRIDITYPIDKIFKCAVDIVDNIYKEIINHDNKKSILNNLMNLTVENYGSSKKIQLYNKLVNNFINELSFVDDFIRKDIVTSAKSIIIDKGYKDFRNINTIIPSVEDLYNAANDKVIMYLCKNVNILIKDINILDVFTMYMNETHIIKLYNDIRTIMMNNRVNVKNYIELQKKVYLMLKSRFNFIDEYIFNVLLKEEKLF